MTRSERRGALKDAAPSKNGSPSCAARLRSTVIEARRHWGRRLLEYPLRSSLSPLQRCRVSARRCLRRFRPRPCPRFVLHDSSLHHPPPPARSRCPCRLFRAPRLPPRRISCSQASHRLPRSAVLAADLARRRETVARPRRRLTCSQALKDGSPAAERLGAIKFYVKALPFTAGALSWWSILRSHLV